MASRFAPLGYAVFCCPEGGDESFLGIVPTLRDARRLAAGGNRGLERCLYDTARLAGHCAGLRAPPGRYGEPSCWFGRGGYYCACPVLPE